jgi:NADH:ubiquinone oxidoreductase subunit 5 (subunit L)/multisubunit Na+/H+ antiporter MnhA subunit
MIAFIGLIACFFNFIYLVWWVKRALYKEYGFVQSEPPQPTKFLGTISAILLIFWGLLLIFIAFWGLTDNPNLEGRNKPWLRAGDEYAIYVLIILVVAVGLSYYLTFLLGEVSGIKEMKKMSPKYSNLQDNDDA